MITGGFIQDGKNLHDGLIFAEQQNVTLSSALNVDDYYGSQIGLGTPYSYAKDVAGTIAAGTTVSSYFVAFDSLQNSQSNHNTITFSSQVLGIEFADGGYLPISNFLGLSSLDYSQLN